MATAKDNSLAEKECTRNIITSEESSNRGTSNVTELSSEDGSLGIINICAFAYCNLILVFQK